MKNRHYATVIQLLTVSAVLTLAGCKLEIRVPQGGSVQSTDGAYVCMAGQTCVIDVVDLFFNQTFVAMPAEGYYFSKWRDRDQYLCPGESGHCSLATADFEGSPELMAILESEETFYLQPQFVFNPVCPPAELVISPASPPAD